MYYSKATNASITVDYLREYIDCFVLGHPFVFLDDFGKITSITEFGNDASVRLKGNNFMKLDHILKINQ